jgi:uncharacterized protein with GYD domain
MAIFVSLLNFTDQGIREATDQGGCTKRFEEILQRHGGKIRELVWTIGPYDMVLVVEVPDDEAAAAVAIEHGAIGTIRSTTLRAFDSQEFGRIVQRLR